MGNMYHPLNSIPRGKRLSSFLYLLAGTVIVSVALRSVGPSVPSIVDYEFAGNVAQAAGIINAWDANARLRAAFNLGLDYLYMPLYSTVIALACLWGSRLIPGRTWRGTGILLAWGLWLAALLDAIENFALITLLFGEISDPYPQIAQICAAGKFSLILLGLVYCAVAAIIRLLLLARPARAAKAG
jgi:hypothetical protein